LNIVYNTLFSNRGVSIFVQSSDEYALSEEEFVSDYLNNHLNAIPLTIIHDEDGRYYRYYISDTEEHIHTIAGSRVLQNQEYSVSIDPNFEIADRKVIILGHNSKSSSIMKGFEAFCSEWYKQDGSNIIELTIIDDEENLVKQEYYKEYGFIKEVISADIFDKEIVCSVLDSMITADEGKVCIIILSDDLASDEEVDVDVLTYLVLIQDIINKHLETEPDFEVNNIDLVVEILNPKNYDIISNFSINNIVISNRYISKMIMQVGEKAAIYNFYDDILNYDIPGEEVFISKEIYVKRVADFFSTIPGPCTAAELIRAVYYESPDENRSVLLGYFNSNGEMTLFSGDQTKIYLALSEEDKLILFSNH